MNNSIWSYTITIDSIGYLFFTYKIPLIVKSLDRTHSQYAREDLITIRFGNDYSITLIFRKTNPSSKVQNYSVKRKVIFFGTLPLVLIF